MPRRRKIIVPPVPEKPRIDVIRRDYDMWCRESLDWSHVDCRIAHDYVAALEGLLAQAKEKGIIYMSTAKGPNANTERA